MRSTAQFKACQIKLLVGGVNAVVRSAKADQQAVASQLLLEISYNGDRGAFTHQYRLIPCRSFYGVRGGSNVR